MPAEIVWEAPDELIGQSNIKQFMDNHAIVGYKELIKRSTEDIEWFWSAIEKSLDIEWFKNYHQILDTSKGIPWAKWFLGGQVNIAHNCLDRHVKSGNKDKVACVWEGEEGGMRRVTFQDLYRQVNKLANALKELKVLKGDRVALYMPMVPEVITILYACFKVGAIPVPIFSGFGPSAVATRLNDSQPRILITADGYLRRGKKVELKKKADSALKESKSVHQVIVYKHANLAIPWKEGRDLGWEEVTQAQSDECPARHLDSATTSLILYTSGTTGKPKGCVHTHIGALLQPAKEIRYGFDLKEDDLFFWLSDIG